MKFSLFLLLLGCSSVPLLGEKPLVGELVFPNGDSLPGSPTGVSEKGNLLWESSFLENKKTPFFTRQIDTIRFFHSQVQPKPETMTTVVFQNRIDNLQDSIRAQLLKFDDETVTVRTRYAGELTLKRSMLEFIEVESEAPPFLSGPGRLTDWNLIENKDAWRIKGKDLITVAKGSIARQLPKSASRIKVEFVITYSYSPYLQVFFFADSGVESSPRDSYSVKIQRNAMNFEKNVKGVSTADMLIAPGAGFGGRHNFDDEAPVLVELYLDREEGEYALYLDGKQITSASDPSPLQGNSWLHFSTLHGREQTLAELAIRPWDGELPKENSHLDFRAKLPVDSERVELHNGDTIIGKATAIDEKSQLEVATEYGNFFVPIERLKSFQLTNPENHEQPRLYSQDVRAHFHHGGHVTLRLSGIDSKTITGYSQVFGDATFELLAFSHIEFNPYEPSFRERRDLPF